MVARFLAMHPRPDTSTSYIHEHAHGCGWLEHLESSKPNYLSGLWLNTVINT